MNSKVFLHHYTSIETLALILKSGRIRFNRLDKVNDLMESEKYGEYDFSKLLFVSCWTSASQESIPLWNMYSNMKGVKITLPLDPFHYKTFKPVVVGAFHFDKEITSFFSPEEIITEKYYVSPQIIENKEAFITPVTYLPDEEFINAKKQAVTISHSSEAPYEYKIKSIPKLAGLKSLRWRFEEEVRYIIMILPALNGKERSEWISEFPKHLLTKLKEDTDLDVPFFDVLINPEYLNNITVTIGPHADPGSKIIVEELLKTFTTNGNLLESELSQKIRK